LFTDWMAKLMIFHRTTNSREMPNIFAPLGLPWIIQTMPAMQPMPEQRTATTQSPVDISASLALAFLAFFRAGSKTSPQKRHLAALARIISPQTGQGLRCSSDPGPAGWGAWYGFSTA